MDKMNKTIKKDIKETNSYDSGLTEAYEFINEQSKCPLCSGDLDIYTEVIPATYSLREEARCIECMALSRVANHTIQ